MWSTIKGKEGEDSKSASLFVKGKRFEGERESSPVSRVVNDQSVEMKGDRSLLPG